MIGSAEVFGQLSSIEDFGAKPLNESQLRVLISVPGEKRAEAWKSAVKLAGDAPLTAKIVRQVALKFKPRKRKTGKAGKKTRGGGKINVGPALKLVEEASGLAKGNEELLNRLKDLRDVLQGLAA